MRLTWLMVIAATEYVVFCSNLKSNSIQYFDKDFKIEKSSTLTYFINFDYTTHGELKSLVVDFISDVMRMSTRTIVLISDNIDIADAVKDTNEPKVIMRSVSIIINSVKLEIDSKGKLLYVIEHSQTHSMWQTVMKIRRSRSKGPILCILSKIDSGFTEKIQFSNYFNVFIAYPFDKVGYILLEKCAYCLSGKNHMEHLNTWLKSKGFIKKLKFPESFKTADLIWLR